MTLVNRLYNLKDAASYLGMSPNTFSEIVRPDVTTIHIKNQRKILFDRLDLDKWVDQYKKDNTGEKSCQQADSICAEVFGISERQSSAAESDAPRIPATLTKRI